MGHWSALRHSGFGLLSSLVIGHWSFVIRQQVHGPNACAKAKRTFKTLEIGMAGIHPLQFHPNGNNVARFQNAVSARTRLVSQKANDTVGLGKGGLRIVIGRYGSRMPRLASEQIPDGPPLGGWVAILWLRR